MLPLSALDRAIPFNPAAIWLYLSFFLIVPAGYLLAPLQRIKWLTLAMQLTALGAGAVYLLWPTTMAYPQNEGVGISAQLLAALTQVDSPQNCLPSLHMALTVLAVWALSDGERKVRTALWMLWAWRSRSPSCSCAAICLSIWPVVRCWRCSPAGWPCA